MTDTDTDIDAALVPGRRIRRRINRDLRGLEKCKSSIENFVNYRRDQWQRDPKLQAMHGTFDQFLAHELKNVMGEELQRQQF